MGTDGALRALSRFSPPTRGILFDFGNTLIPFGQREMGAIAAALVESI